MRKMKHEIWYRAYRALKLASDIADNVSNRFSEAAENLNWKAGEAYERSCPPQRDDH